ncbi:LysR substrate-binding domain-containing protein [Ruegeria sp. HKCCD8929]|uniref:LysR substrate-binding domain-containing protein n=1 Tax=Ruegeria sp. HKCCD8929 TaxID=2683006 RepID=UPI001489C0D3|nr:LysR substrate-binding domain-containing protein [Ruegeria sp. HKCCD8929]
MNLIDWHKLPPLTTLRAFEATGRLGGYSAAARSLNVTTAAIAQQVRKLEADLGIALVRRDGRGLALTAAGRTLAGTLNDAFEQIAKGIDDVSVQEAARGVRVSTTVRFVDAVIMPRLSDFWAKHPGVQVSFAAEGNSWDLDLEAFDIAIRGGPPDHVWNGAAQKLLLKSPFVLCGTPELVRSSAKDLAGVPWIRDNSIGGHVFEGVVRDVGLSLAELQLVDPGGPKFELDAALQGYGLHLSPEVTVKKHLDQGDLEAIDIRLDWVACYFAVYRKGRVSNQVNNFLKWLTVTCAPLSYGA